MVAIKAATTESINFNSMLTNYAFLSSEEGAVSQHNLQVCGDKFKGYNQHITMRNTRVARWSNHTQVEAIHN